MSTYGFNAIGVIEVSFYSNAVVVLDAMLKSAEVKMVSCQKRLGGRLVSTIIAGDTSAVVAAVESAIKVGERIGSQHIKVAVAIPNPHAELIKLLQYIQSESPKPILKEEKKVPLPTEKTTTKKSTKQQKVVKQEGNKNIGKA